VAHAGPALVQVAVVLEPQLVALHQPQVVVVFRLKKVLQHRFSHSEL
jgi:hypothetical protein